MARLKLEAAASRPVAVIAAVALGLVVGIFLGRLLVGAQTFTIDDLATLIGLIAGGVLVNVIASWGDGPEALMWYVIGLAIGLVVYLADPFGWFPRFETTEATLRMLHLAA